MYSTIIAESISNFRDLLIKKVIYCESFAFSTSTIILSSIITFQCNESPCSNFGYLS